MEIDFAKLEKDYDSVIFEGKKYILTAQADFTNRLLDCVNNYNNKNEEDGGYWFEMSCPAVDEQGNNYEVFWEFYCIPSDEWELDMYDYSKVCRVVKEEN